MPWDQLCLYIYNLHCQVLPVMADGFCFLHAIDMILYLYHNEVVTFHSMESMIMGHLAANVKYSNCFHTEDIFKDAERYFKLGMYCDNILDVIIVATARSLMLNLIIYQKGPKGNIQILQHTTHGRGKEVLFKFT